MLAAERRTKIVELVREQGSVQVEALARELHVSAMTIRRDLVKLQEEDRIQRCHGGAVIKEETTYADKQTSNIDAKKELAKRAASFVKMGDTVFLDAGTTTYEIARLIKDVEEILVVTNDLEIARLLNASRADVIICGGRIQKSTGSMFDRYATRMLSDFQFDIGFFGAASIDEEFQVMTPTVDKMWLKREAEKQCAQSYLVVDASKFGRTARTKINHLGDFTGVITDRKFEEKEWEKLEKLGCRILSG